MQIKKVIVVIVILFVGLWGGYRYFNSTNKDNEETQKIIHPLRGDISNVVTTTATVLPQNRLEIKPPVNGRVDQILVVEGQQVKAGQIVAWMSSTDRAALLDAARGKGEQEYKKWIDTYKAIPLLAPIDGQVIVATTQPGQTVITTDAVIVLSDHLIVRAQVDETDIGKIKLDQEAMVTLDAYPDMKISAKVSHIYFESKIYNNVTVYDVDLSPSQIPSFFRSGMNASVDFIVEKKENVLLLPVAAIIKKEEDSFVLLRSTDDRKPIKQSIQLGISDDKNVEIIKGLKEEDEVVMKQKKLSLDKKNKGTNPFMPQRPKGSGR